MSPAASQFPAKSPANKQAITGRNRPTSPAYPLAAAPLPGAPREVSACIRLSTTGNSNSPKAAKYLGISVNTLSKRQVDGDRPVRAKTEDFCWLSSDAGALLLWLTDPMVVTGKAQRLIEAWRFIPKTVEFYWAKATKDGTGFPVGNAYHTRANPEQCGVAVRGHPKRQDKGVPRLIIAPRERHSAKPDIVHDRIERLYPGPYLELFARQSRPGCTSWGNQLDSGPIARRWASNSYPQEEAAE